MIFASIPLFKVVRWDGIVVDSALDEESARSCQMFWTGSRIEPINTPNAVLTALRDTPESLRPWALDQLLDALQWDVRAAELYRAPVRNSTEEEREHALRVLTRLVALS